MASKPPLPIYGRPGEGSKLPASRKGSVELRPHLLGAGVRLELGLWGSAKDTAATAGPAGRVTGPSVAPNAFLPTHLGPNSLGQAVGHGQHPLGGNERSCADICAIGLHTDHPWPSPNHGIWIPEGGVQLTGHAADWGGTQELNEGGALQPHPMAPSPPGPSA